jgi:hypothetical protein
MCELSKRPTEKLTTGCKDNIKIDALHVSVGYHDTDCVLLAQNSDHFRNVPKTITKYRAFHNVLRDYKHFYKKPKF